MLSRELGDLAASGRGALEPREGRPVRDPRPGPGRRGLRGQRHGGGGRRPAEGRPDPRVQRHHRVGARQRRGGRGDLAAARGAAAVADGRRLRVPRAARDRAAPGTPSPCAWPASSTAMSTSTPRRRWPGRCWACSQPETARASRPFRTTPRLHGAGRLTTRRAGRGRRDGGRQAQCRTCGTGRPAWDGSPPASRSSPSRCWPSRCGWWRREALPSRRALSCCQ